MTDESLGLGVMSHSLTDNSDSVKAIRKAYGDTILDAKLTAKTLILIFSDYELLLTDEGQSCCEYRYMDTDDDLSDLFGTTLLALEINGERIHKKEGEDKYGEHHDVEFLDVKTDRGTLSIANHNEHNGYYGGFSIEAQIRERKND